MTNLSASTVIELEDFAYFATSEENRHPIRKAAVERKFCDLASQIATQSVMRKAIRLYGGKQGGSVNPGLFRRDRGDFWISIGPKQHRPSCHFTVRIDQEGISVDCFAPHRTYTKRIIRAIREQPDEFLKSLRAIPQIENGFAVRLREAYYANPKSSYKGQRIGRIRDFLEVHPREITPENLQTLVLDPIEQRFQARNLRPELFLVRYFTLKEVIGSKDVAALVARAAERMLPFLIFALHHAGE